MKNSFKQNRPLEFHGRGDRYLADIAAGLLRKLLKNQKNYASPTLVLEREALGELALVLVEFAEDTHADIGIWRSLESAQQERLGTPLPFFVAPEESSPALSPFDQRRVQFLLWTLSSSFFKNLILSPTHPDLSLLSEVASNYLAEHFPPIPKDSGVKKFLATENRFGWDVKRKLVWLGLNSYLFRLLWKISSESADSKKSNIPNMDDFICQGSTLWAGLGAIDILAGTLDLPEEDRETLRSWYERHMGAYRMLATSNPEGAFITARNIVNGEPYTIRLNRADSLFKPGILIIGSLTPWHGEWYWSGEQKNLGTASEALEAEIRADFFKQGNFIYRYCLPEAETVRQQAKQNHEKFVAHYGSEFVRFPDGLTAVAEEQKRLQKNWDNAPPEGVQKALKAAGLTEPPITMKFPPQFLAQKEGIGVFSHPHEGVELLSSYNHITSGMQKQGKDLTSEEAEAIRGAITSRAICPAYIYRLVNEYGAQSIARAFCISNQPLPLVLEVLLRQFKGHFYRRHYPPIVLRA